MTFPAAMAAIRERVASVAEPIWGRRTTLSSDASSLGMDGSFSYTSRPAPAILPCPNASANAVWSTTGPRAVLTKTA